MTTNETGFLSRWSRLKREQTTAPGNADQASSAPVAKAVSVQPPEADAQAIVAALPPVESVLPGADISAFMQAKVPDALKRQALKAMLRDPHFNVMDGLDVYIDDYNLVPDLPPDWWKDSKVMGTILNPKKMVVDEDGNAVWEDEEVAKVKADDVSDAEAASTCDDSHPSPSLQDAEGEGTFSDANSLAESNKNALQASPLPLHQRGRGDMP